MRGAGMTSRIPWWSEPPAIVHGARLPVQTPSTPGPSPSLVQFRPMSVTAHFARRFRFLTLLRASLIAGALYDLAFALLMVFAPELPARSLALPLPPLP